MIIIGLLPLFLLCHGVEVLNAPRSLGLCLLLTGFFQAAYFVFLSLAYQQGDLSVVYPLARISPVFVVPLAGFLQGQWPTFPAFLGILIVVAGCALLPLRSLSFPSLAAAWKQSNRSAVLWALATALVSGGYTVTGRSA